MITDDEIMTTYDRYPFELVESRLATTRETLEDTPIDVLATALQLSATNAIISMNTNVQAHERATIAVWNAIDDGVTDPAALASAMDLRSPDGKHAVMYYNQKAKMLNANLLTVDWVDIAETLREEGSRACQQELVDEVTGLKTRKAGFTLANLGWTDACCMDSIMERAFAIKSGTTDGRWDAKHPFATKVVDRYYDRIDDLRAETPEAADLERYLWQWAAWTSARDDGFATHDPWFLLLDDLLEVDVFEPTIRQPALAGD